MFLKENKYNIKYYKKNKIDLVLIKIEVEKLNNIDIFSDIFVNSII